MKKKIIIGISVVLALVLGVCVFCILSGRWILPHQVRLVELRGFDSCDDAATKNVQLTKDEIGQLLFHYNLSQHRGRVDAESCDSDYGFVIHLTSGETIKVREAGSPRIEVYDKNSASNKYWRSGIALDLYIKFLLEKYQLVTP
ncbi:MAG: hypothetical protein E7436_02835 [Ruminococcaceae bacterium]|nr:hypothetical protein [Oscillospiraceae bacterium]